MANTKIKYRQLDLALQVVDADIASNAAISTTKLADGANFLNKNGSVVWTGTQNAGANKLSNLAEPTAGTDAATKNYVDAARQGLDVKESVRVATTSNITLSGVQTIDGVSLTVGDRVLVKNQTTGVQNGIYNVVSAAWTRSTDADDSSKVTANMFAFVEEGTVGSDTGWTLSNNGVVTLGTTVITFVQFSSAGIVVADESTLTKVGNVVSVKANGITSTQIAALTITNAQISSSAAIDPSKIATSASNRFVTDTEKSTWNGKQDVIALGTTAQYWRGDKTFQTLNTSAVPEGTSQYFTAARVLATPLTGMVLTNSADVIASDSVVTAFGKLQAQLDLTQTGNANLTALAGLTGAADKVIYFTGAGAMAHSTLTSFARTLLDDTTQSAMQSTLGLVPGTNVQAYDSTLINAANLKTSFLLNYIVRETVGGTLNGSNTAFTLANAAVAGTEMLFLNGVLQNPGASNDYIISGSSITLSGPPISGDIILCTYFK